MNNDSEGTTCKCRSTAYNHPFMNLVYLGLGLRYDSQHIDYTYYVLFIKNFQGKKAKPLLSVNIFPNPITNILPMLIIGIIEKVSAPILYFIIICTTF